MLLFYFLVTLKHLMQLHFFWSSWILEIFSTLLEIFIIFIRNGLMGGISNSHMHFQGTPNYSIFIDMFCKDDGIEFFCVIDRNPLMFVVFLLQFIFSKSYFYIALVTPQGLDHYSLTKHREIKQFTKAFIFTGWLVCWWMLICSRGRCPLRGVR